MLPTANRMRGSVDFTAVVRQGRRVARPTVVVHLLAPESESHRAVPSVPPALVGFVVSKAVGGAVARNRVRRRLRHLVRDRLRGLPAGARVVVRANPGAVTRAHRVGPDLDSALASARVG